MVKTTLAEYGSSVIAGSEGDEEILPAQGNGSAVPGDLVSIGSNRRVVGADLGASELLTGILMEHPTLGCETAITAGLFCSVVVPKSGHRYNIRCLDLNTAAEIGFSLDVSATAGKADAAADVNNAVCKAARPIADGDTVAQVFWT